PVLTQKVFANIRRVGKGFSGVETPLFKTILAVRDVAEEAEAQILAQGDDVQEHAEEEVATDVVPPTPTSPLPSSPVIPTSPPHQSPSPPQLQSTEGSSHVFQQVLDTCSALVLRVEVLENANAAQQLDIVKLKARVKKLEKLYKVISSKLRQLRKVGTFQRVESSDDVENVVAASTPIPAAKPKILKIVAAPAVSTRRRKGVVIRDPKKELHIDTPAETPIMKDKGKGILIEDPKPIKKKDQIEMDAEKLSKEAQEADDLKKKLEIVQDEDDDMFVEVTPLAQKVPVVDYHVIVIDNKPKYKIIRADDTHQFYISFTTLLKNFDREDLETLWRIVRDRFSTSKPTNFLDEYLLLTLKTMFGELDEQDAIWRN
nr:hypothetical protein [Tanacetum cinerariifolium]